MIQLPNPTRMLLLACLAFSGVAAAEHEAIRVARYSEISSVSTADRDPLSAVATLTFPRQIVSTVGDALRYLLHRTGYSLQAGDADSTSLFALPFPETQRRLGPYHVSTLLQIVVGDAYIVCASAHTRTVTVRSGTVPANASACREVQP